MRFIGPSVLALAALILYLLLWPVPMTPRIWTPPTAPALAGVYAPNDRLKDVQRLAVGVGTGPEGIAVDAVGRIYAGYDDGRVIELSRNGANYTEIGNTGGRPLGISFGPDGGILVADANQGLLRVGARPQAEVLVTEAGGEALHLTDDVVDSRLDKWVYFTDSDHYPLSRYHDDFLEHSANGRLIRYNVRTRQSEVLLSGLHFANGVALGPDDQFVLVCETSEYRVQRYWLKGPKAGTHEVFIDNLPGLPDNISFNGHDRVWLALVTPRDPGLDTLLGGTLWRKILYRLPRFLQPKPKRHGFVLGLDLDGRVIANLQYAGPGAYAPITSVVESGPWLYFGSLSENAIARLPLNRVVANAPPLPAGWEKAPATPTATTFVQREDDD